MIDHRFGRIMNANIAEYHVPVNADVHDIEVIFVDEPDDDDQSARHQGGGRDRHRRRRRGDRQRGLSRDRQARARSADHAGQAAALTATPAGLHGATYNYTIHEDLHRGVTVISPLEDGCELRGGCCDLQTSDI